MNSLRITPSATLCAGQKEYVFHCTTVVRFEIDRWTLYSTASCLAHKYLWGAKKRGRCEAPPRRMPSCAGAWATSPD